MPLLLYTVAWLVHVLGPHKSHFQFKHIIASKVLILCSYEENAKHLRNWEENIIKTTKG